MSDEPIPCCWPLPDGAYCLLPAYHDPAHTAHEPEHRPERTAP
jgi:hypothetical protein